MSVAEDRYRGTREYQLVYAELIQAARYQGVSTYQAIAQLMGLPLTGSYMGKMVGWMLGEIGEDEHLHGRPLLSALVVTVKGKPSFGFCVLARQLGLLQDDSPEAEEAFWEAVEPKPPKPAPQHTEETLTILRLVEEGKITPEEADKLLRALGA